MRAWLPASCLWGSVSFILFYSDQMPCDPEREINLGFGSLAFRKQRLGLAFAAGLREQTTDLLSFRFAAGNSAADRIASSRSPASA